MRRLACLPTALLTLVLAPAAAFASAGGGSSGFGGGGGGGGGFSGGGGSGTGSGEGSPVVFLLIVLVVGGILLFGFVAERRRRRRRAERVRRTIAVSAEAAEDDPWFAADAVVASAADLYRRCQAAWDARDREALASLVGDDLMVEWRRRLDDFDAKGWHNRVEVREGPRVEYVGLVNREDDTEDRVVVRLEAKLRDVVEAPGGVVHKRNGASSEVVTVAEWWTLARRGDRWIVVSIEQDKEGDHHVDAPLVPSPWSDEQRLADETALERAAGDALPAGVAVAEVADVDLADEARARALDLSLVDERFSPHVLEAAARRVVAAWAEAVDGEDEPLEAVADPAAVRALLYPGDPSGRTRLVVRGPRLRAIRIVALDPSSEPPQLRLEVDVEGRRYVEDRDTLALVSGSRSAETRFTERWTLGLSGGGDTPWRLLAPAGEASR